MKTNSKDWKEWESGWKYKGDIRDPQYLKDRNLKFSWKQTYECIQKLSNYINDLGC